MDFPTSKLSQKKNFNSVDEVANQKKVVTLSDYIAKTVITKKYIPEAIPYNAIIFRNREGYPVAFYNKPGFVMPGPEESIRTLPVQKALPSPTGERILMGIRSALKGEAQEQTNYFSHRGLIHEIHGQFIPWTEEIAMTLLRSTLPDRKFLSGHDQTVHQLSRLYQSRTWLAPTDPHIVFWIDKDGIIRDQRYQPEILLRNRQKPCIELRTIEEEFVPDNAKVVKHNLVKALETGEPQHFRLNLIKGQCWVTEDCISYPLNTGMVMNTATDIRSVDIKNALHYQLFERDVTTTAS